MLSLKERVNYVLEGEDGASNVELIVWFSVVFVIATVLFLFRDAVNTFIKNVIGRIQSFQVQ